MNRSLVLLTGIWCIAFASAPVLAEESSDAPAFTLVVESTVAGEDAGDWAAAAATIARAHAKHPQGNLFATYRQLTGGPAEVVRVLFPFDRMADLDGWVSSRQILYETLGNDRGQLVLDDLELAEESTERIVAYSEKLSRPRELTRAPRYLWVVAVEVAAGRMNEYAALASRLAAAHDRANSNKFWMVYGNALGGDRSELTYLHGFESFAALDDWPSWSEVLTEAYGAGEAARLAVALEGLSERTTSLWALESELSQMESK